MPRCNVNTANTKLNLTLCLINRSYSFDCRDCFRCHVLFRLLFRLGIPSRVNTCNMNVLAQRTATHADLDFVLLKQLGRRTYVHLFQRKPISTANSYACERGDFAKCIRVQKECRFSHPCTRTQSPDLNAAAQAKSAFEATTTLLKMTVCLTRKSSR